MSRSRLESKPEVGVLALDVLARGVEIDIGDDAVVVLDLVLPRDGPTVPVGLARNGGLDGVDGRSRAAVVVPAAQAWRGQTTRTPNEVACP